MRQYINYLSVDALVVAFFIRRCRVRVSRQPNTRSCIPPQNKQCDTHSSPRPAVCAFTKKSNRKGARVCALHNVRCALNLQAVAQDGRVSEARRQEVGHTTPSL